MLHIVWNTQELRARGVAGLTRLPVTEEIAGSNPVGPAKSYQSCFYTTHQVALLLFEPLFCCLKSSLKTTKNLYQAILVVKFDRRAVMLF
jgi:hypothetical protein